MENADAIVDSALSLPVERRADLADRLLDSLGDTKEAPDASSEDCAKEVQRRSAEMDTGQVQGVVWEEVRDAIDERLTDRRPS